MAFNKYGFKTISHIGSVNGEAGTNRSLHSYVTNDNTAAIETSNYFDEIYDRVQPGDLLLVSIDMDGTNVPGVYVFGKSGGHVTVTALPLS